jgi:hypothetical protein
MRWAFSVLIAILAVCCLQRAVAQTAEEKADFEFVQSIGTQKAYEVFLRTHPNGHYADVVRKRLHEMTPVDMVPKDRRLEPNWGDGMFIDRLMQKQK